MKTKELTKFMELKIDDSGEGMYVSRIMSEHRGNDNGKSRSKSKGFDRS